jgi:hypothetical protein
VEIAVREHALPPLWNRITAVGAAFVPSAAAELLLRRSLASSIGIQQLHRVLDEVIQTLSALNVELMVLKGAALGTTVFASPLERPMNDLDLLLKPDHAGLAHDHLMKKGWRLESDPREDLYRDHHHLQPLYHPTALGGRLELHTSLFGPEHPFDFDASDLWRDRQPSKLGLHVWLPHPNHLFLHACAHFAWSHMMEFGAWRCFRDIAVLLERGAVDWQQISALARQTRTASSVYWTLRLMQRLVGTPIPRPALQSLRPKLPDSVLAVLERHFLLGLPSDGQRSPSVRVDRAMWRLGLFPFVRVKGSHPWKRNPLFAADDPSVTDSNRGASGRRAVAWRQYIRALTSLDVR